MRCSVTFLKPWDSTTREYTAGANCKNWKPPLLSLTASNLAVVAWLVSVSLAPVIAAPLGSFTNPAMLPVGDAETVVAIRRIMSANAHMPNCSLRHELLDDLEIRFRSINTSTPSQVSFLPVPGGTSENQIYGRTYCRSRCLSSPKRRLIVSTSRCPVVLARDLSGSSIFSFRRCGGSGERKSRGGCGISSLRECRFGTSMGRAVLRVAADQVRPVAHAPGAVQVFADQHAAFGQRASPFGLLHLQRAVGYPHGVVLVHHAFLLHGENAFQILAAGGNKGAFRLRGRHRKLAVQLGNVALPQEAICFLHGGDPPQPQLLRQPSLPGTEVPLAAPACLWRIRRYHLNAQVPHGPAHLR